MSLSNRLAALEADLAVNPPRISAYSELPCALFQYDPDDEWTLRRELGKLKTRLENAGKRVHLLSLARFLWQAVEQVEGLEPVVELELEEGWEAAQRQVGTYLSDADFLDLSTAIAEAAAGLESQRDILFLWRAAALSPGIYRPSKLLDQLKGKLLIPTVLFYPGVFDEQGLRFMGLPDRESSTSYRVKIYH